MGLVALALVGGAGYLAVKKINKKKLQRYQRYQAEGCNGRCNHHAQNRGIDELNPSQQYHDASEKNLPQYYDHPTATYPYPNEKGGVQEIREIKH